MASKSPHFESLRCSPCDINWPYDRPVYDHCPECGTMTLLSKDDASMTDAEGASRKKHAEFERFYRAREDQIVAEFHRELDHGLSTNFQFFQP